MSNDLEKWDQVMHAVTAEAIESLAFMEVSAAEDFLGSDESVLWVTLLVYDPVQGEFQLIMPRELISEIAEIVYGPLMDEITDQNILDLLAEMLNTIAGRFLSEILPDDESFKLGIPESAKGIYLKPEPPAKIWNFAIDEMRFSLSASGESLLQLCKP